MSQGPSLEPERTPALAAARARARKISAAGEKVEMLTADIRLRLTAMSVVFPGLPLALLLGMLNQGAGNPAVVVLGTLVATPVLTYLVSLAFDRMLRRRHAPDPAFQRVLDKCLEADKLPPPIDAAIDQALEAYFSLRKLGEEPDWKRVGYPMDAHLNRAGERVVELLEWARRLSIIGNRLEQTRGAARDTPEFRETQTHYLAQCAQIAAAASAFGRVEAKVTLAYAALSASAARDSSSAAQLQELTATFDALTEVLSASEPGPRIAAPVEEPQVVVQRH